MSADEKPEQMLSTHFIRRCLIVILQESLDKLFILKKINNWPDKQNRISEYISLEEKMKLNAYIDEQKEVNNVTHFHDQCIFVESMLISLLEEVTTKGTYEEFEKIVNDYKTFNCEKNTLIEETEQMEEDLEEFHNTYYKEGSNYYEKISKCMSDMGQLKDEIEDFRTESEAKHNFVLDWENSKMEMNEIIALRKQKQKIEEIEHTNIQLNREERIHAEILCAYEEFEKDLTVVLENWKVKYQIDLAERSKKLDVLRDKYNIEAEKIQKRRELFQKRDKEMSEYKAYKIERERIKAEKETKQQSAIRIQAWWRGVMVRRGFGKFKKKKDKKLKKRSSEKKIEIPEIS